MPLLLGPTHTCCNIVKILIDFLFIQFVLLQRPKHALLQEFLTLFITLEGLGEPGSKALLAHEELWVPGFPVEWLSSETYLKGIHSRIVSASDGIFEPLLVLKIGV